LAVVAALMTSATGVGGPAEDEAHDDRREAE
jgi:hypothetical protein